MIDPQSRELEWLKVKKQEHPKLDIQLIEKTIRAFSLLESLALSGCKFVFKGGTATMLHLNSERRISIDIDIVCPPGTQIEKYINLYGADYGFIATKLENRVSPHNVPKTHGKFFYRVTYNTGHEEDAILLDVLFEDNYYGNLVELPIRSSFLINKGSDIYVKVPSIEDILGDKLTAFAPHTMGIPFYKGRKDTTMEVIKQMYDVASLFDYAADMAAVRTTYMQLAPVEMNYRNLQCDITDILTDTINTALCLSLRGQIYSEDFPLLQRGVTRINNHIINESYNIDPAIRDAAKAAYVAALVKHGKTSFKRYSFDEAKQLAGMKTLSNKLNKLKKTNTEAFFYWSMTDSILNEEL